MGLGKKKASIDSKLRLIKFASDHSDEEIVSFVESLILAGELPFWLGIFFTRWLALNRSPMAIQIINLLRKHRYDGSRLDEVDCKWIWSRGWREVALEKAVIARNRWHSMGLATLVGAMREMLAEETVDERMFRLSRISQLDRF